MEHSTNMWQAITKRTALTSALALALMLTALLVAATSAYAQPQGSVTATGVLVGPVEDGDQDPTPKYRLTDEETDTNYVLISGFVDLDPYAGQRVTIAGEPIGGADWAPPALNVTHIEPADGGGDNDPPAVNDKATLSYELTVDGDPPSGTTFYGHVHTGEGGPGRYVPLTDPDEDRVYTGSTIVDRFGPGPRPVPPSVEPVSLPVRIVQESDGNLEVIKDFGTVKLDGDKTFEASVSFPVDDCPIISRTPEQCGDGSSGPGNDGGGGSGSGNPNSGGSGGDGSGSSSGGSGDGTSGDSSSGAWGSDSGNAESSSGGIPSDIANGLRGVLPSTGGGTTALWVLGAGVVLIAGGLLVRKAFQ